LVKKKVCLEKKKKITAGKRHKNLAILLEFLFRNLARENPKKPFVFGKGIQEFRYVTGEISANPKLALLGGIDGFGWWDRPPNNCCCCCNRRVPRYLPDLNWSSFPFCKLRIAYLVHELDHLLIP
jgi:hypothetical protein